MVSLKISISKYARVVLDSAWVQLEVLTQPYQNALGVFLNFAWTVFVRRLWW